MKKTNWILLFLVAGIVCVVGCKNTDSAATTEQTTPAFDMVAAKTAIATEGDVFVAALNKRDSVGLANCYTTDAKFMHPNAPAVVGRENIQKLFGQWMKTGMPHFAMKTVEVWGDENVMTAEAEYTFTDKDSKIVDQGKAIEVFKMDDGKWRLYRDCYNSDMPAAK